MSGVSCTGPGEVEVCQERLKRISEGLNRKLWKLEGEQARGGHGHVWVTWSCDEEGG